MWDIAPKLSVVVPVYNEAENLPPLYQRLTPVLEAMGEPYEVIFVDDGSRDASFEVLRGICRADDRVKVVQLRRNFGQTAALVAGFDHASGDVIVTMDADLQNDPSDVPLLVQKLDEGYDIVSGWRRNRKDPLLSKNLPSRISNRLASRLTGISLHDFGCTLKAYRREVVKGIHLYGELHRYIPAVASSLGVRVAEMEVRHHPRMHGRSKYGVMRIARGLLDLVTLKLLLTYMNRPMQMFGGLGILAMLMGILSGSATLAMKAFGYDVTGNPLLYLTILLLVASMQFISMGFLGEIASRTYHETQNKPIYAVRQVLDGMLSEPADGMVTTLS